MNENKIMKLEIDVYVDPTSDLDELGVSRVVDEALGRSLDGSDGVAHKTVRVLAQQDLRCPGATLEMPQPWHDSGTTREAYMASAAERESAGSRLVIETWVGGHPDPMGDGDTWFVDWIEYTDWRTGEHIWGFDPDATEPNGERDGFLVVERRLAEVA